MDISGTDPIREFSQSILALQKTKESHVKLSGGVRGTDLAQGEAVAFSPELKEHDQLIKQIKDLPDIRAELLAPIQEALAQKTFEVKGELIAAALIKETVFDTVA